MGAMARDLTWDATWTVAERLDRRARRVGAVVRARRWFSLRRLRWIEALELTDHWGDVLEPVRWRRPWSRRWHVVQPPAAAAAALGAVLPKHAPRGSRTGIRHLQVAPAASAA